jgi:hypothetical protein
MLHLSKGAIDQGVAEVALMPFFPSSDPEARAMLIRYFLDICHTDDQVLWLAKRYVTLFPKWAGLRELRAVACGKFKPRDEVEVYSEGYPDGIPAEKEPRPMIEAPRRDQLAGVSADPESRQLIADIMESTSLAPWVPPAERRARERREIQEAEKEIAEAVGRPTLSEEEKARRIAELENALGIK